MMGGMLAGHDQSGGELIERDGKQYKIFYGMSSSTAMKKHSGGVAEYRYVRVGAQIYHHTYVDILGEGRGFLKSKNLWGEESHEVFGRVTCKILRIWGICWFTILISLGRACS